jgi:hypothetical protein
MSAAAAPLFSAEPAFCVWSATSAYVPIWRAWRLSSADVLCARSVRGGQARIGRYVAGPWSAAGSMACVTGRCDDAVSAGLGEEPPGPGDAFEFVLAAVDEIEAGADYKGRDGS